MNRKTGVRPLSITALAVVAAVSLSGCIGGTPAAEDDRIGVAMMGEPGAALSPFSDDASSLSRWSTVETLLRLNEDLGVDPLLATEWEQVDDLTWVFTLRDDVVFHDGTPLDAEAVKNSFDQAFATSSQPRALSGITLTTEVTGDHEITVTTDHHDPMLTHRLASPQMSILSEAAYEDGGIVNPVGTGTGPFVLTEVDGTTSASLDRFDDYWGDVAALSGIDVSFVLDGTARAAALGTGDADVAEMIPVSQAGTLDEDQITEVLTPRSTYVTLNTASGPFADPAVRAAARAAVDPSVIAESVYEGRADVASGVLGPAIPWAEDLRGDIESGVEPVAVDGVEITLATYTERVENPEIAVQIESQLEAAGFVVTQDVREYVNMEEEMLSGEFDAVILSRGTLLDTGDPLLFLAQDFGCDAGYNIPQLCDSATDGILEAGLLLPSGDERNQAAADAESAILRTDSVIPLVHERGLQGESGAFTDIAQDPIQRRLITEYTQAAG